MANSISYALSASGLRRELSYRGRKHARLHPHELSYGSVPCVIFQAYDGEHGNFHPASYSAIQQDCCWSRRLAKTYTAGKWVPRRWDRARAELDCANSSDALLMNIFCYPGVLDSTGLCCLLGIERGLHPAFGFKPRIPLVNGRVNGRPSALTDQTEVDMQLGHLLVEAKLTESGFQTASMEQIMRYAAVEETFEMDELPRKEPASGMPQMQSYQLIRGVLAARHMDRSFAVFCDARRVDLRERWYQVMRAVRHCELRNRLALVTWQEIAGTLPIILRDFLDDKYGIQAG